MNAKVSGLIKWGGIIYLAIFLPEIFVETGYNLVSDNESKMFLRQKMLDMFGGEKKYRMLQEYTVGIISDLHKIEGFDVNMLDLLVADGISVDKVFVVGQQQDSKKEICMLDGETLPQDEYIKELDVIVFDVQNTNTSEDTKVQPLACLIEKLAKDNKKQFIKLW